MGEFGASRRHVIRAVGVAGAAGPLLAACSDDGGGGSSTDGEAGPSINCSCHGSKFSIEDGSVLSGPAGRPLAKETVSVEGDELTVAGSILGSAADVPVGSGAVFREQKFVVTQPEAGTFKAFSAVCTHQQCIVRDVTA